MDFLRGLALILMIYFHAIYDMNEFYGYPIQYEGGINFYIGKAAAVLFILISGMSCSLSKNNLRRGFKVFAIALLISIFTYLLQPDYFIQFGILHFLSVSIFSYPLLRKANGAFLFAIGSFFLWLQFPLSKVTVTVNYLFPLGLYQDSFRSSDYYPMIPWFGVFVYGILLGKLLYQDRKSLLRFPLGNNIISLAGRRTLLIYLIHQPILLLLLALLHRYILTTPL